MVDLSQAPVRSLWVDVKNIRKLIKNITPGYDVFAGRYGLFLYTRVKAGRSEL